VVLPDSALDGVNVATVSAVLKLTVPATAFPPAVTVNDTVLGVTGWENVAVGADDTATPVDPEPGVAVETTGGVAPADGEYTTSSQELLLLYTLVGNVFDEPYA
jgi:hypothetical protein